MPSSTASAQTLLLMRYGIYIPPSRLKKMSVNYLFLCLCLQLVMMNGSFLIGCLSPGSFAHSLGVLNMLVTAAFSCTVLIFATVGLTSIPSLVAISILFGYFFGLCKWLSNKRLGVFLRLTFYNLNCYYILFF